MYAIYIGMAAAAATGALLGGAFKLQASDLKGGFGEQVVFGSQFDDASTSVMSGRVGPVPEYVIGTDWTRPPVQTAYAAPVYEVSTRNIEDYVLPATYSAAAHPQVAGAEAPRARPVLSVHRW